MRQATAMMTAPSRRATAPWLVVAVACCAVAAAGDAPRDWSRVELAWRDDPRAAGDVPAGEAVPPRRPSRRALRRAARRGLSFDDVPVGVPRPAAPGSLDGIVHQAESAAPAIRSGRQPPISVAATLTSPFADDEAVLAHRDQPYGGDDARRRFDIHLPGTCQAGSLPLVVWIAGDDWQGGTRADCPLVWLVERGYAVASVDYRPCTAAPFPAPLDDCRAALATLVREAETWGVDPGRICVVGRGAGGHLAALVALADAPAGADVPAAEVAAACAVAAPAHLPSLGPAERTAAAAGRLVGGPLPEFREAAQAASPLAHASADDPPMLLVHGGRDAEVPAAQAAGLDRALKAAGADSRLVLLDTAGHAVPLAAGSEGGTAILEFLDRVLGPGARETLPPAIRPAGASAP